MIKNKNNQASVIRAKRSYRIGREIVADLKGCDARVIDDVQLLKRLVQEAIRTTKHHLLDITARKFHPIGVTVLGLLAESHISLHTYPELNYVAIDIFTCGNNKPEPILEYLQEKFGAKEMYWEYIRRGVMKQWKTIYENDGYKREVEVQKILHHRETPYQTIEVVRAKKLGICLFCNNTLQMATLDTHEYDEQMIKYLDDAKVVLIVGGGDCSILKELVQHKNIKDIYMLEQDQQVIEVARKYLGAAQALKDPRLKMFYGNATETISYLKDKKVDVALFDIINYPEHKAKRFYGNLFEQLAGIGCPSFVTQAGQSMEKEERNVILGAAKKYYKNIKAEDKYCFSTGMLKFIYGHGLK
ncbi:MAG: adenosylmethionine decarboxylase [Candidatus Magasanikbacteria bacterium]